MLAAWMDGIRNTVTSDLMQIASIFATNLTFKQPVSAYMNAHKTSPLEINFMC